MRLSRETPKTEAALLQPLTTQTQAIGDGHPAAPELGPRQHKVAPPPKPFSARIHDAAHALSCSIAAVLEGVAALGAPTGAALAASPLPMASPVHATTGVLKSAYGDASLVGDVILRDGHASGDIGFRPYTRAYGQAQKGPLRFRHGSPVPSSTILSAAERKAIDSEAPGNGLDRMAKLLGRSTGFEAMAKSKDFFNTEKPAWWGLCAPWSWTALHPKIGPLVDAPGPEGARGRWFMGEWLSRADLGNWTMAVTSPFVEYAAESPSAISVGEVGPVGILRAANVLLNSKVGFIADVFNDKANGVAETWNQPFYAVEVNAAPVSASAQKSIVAMAEADGWHISKVKAVTVIGKYGVEVNDDHEGPPASAQKTWNMIVGVDSEGNAVWGKMADDPALASVAGLPTHKTDAPPDYIVSLPLDIVDDALQNKPSILFENHKYGPEAQFFLGTVLPNAVSGEERTAFEKAVAALPAGPISAEQAFSLRLAHPHVANAYSPVQWQSAFGARGLEAKAFGSIE